SSWTRPLIAWTIRDAYLPMSGSAATSRPRMTMKPDLRRRLGVAAGMVLAMSLPAAAADCGKMSHDGNGYVICQVAAEQEPALKLWQDGEDGRPLRNFSNVRKTLGEGESLSF